MSYLVNEESVIVVDRGKHKDPLNDLGLDPPVLEVPRHVVDEHRVHHADVFPQKLHNVFVLSHFSAIIIKYCETLARHICKQQIWDQVELVIQASRDI